MNLGIGKTTFALKSLLLEAAAILSGKGNFLTSWQLRKRETTTYLLGNNLATSSEVAKMLINAVRSGLLLSTSFRVELAAEERQDLRWALLGRLLYDLLRPSEPYSKFVRKLSSVPSSIVDCFNSLQKCLKLAGPLM